MRGSPLVRALCVFLVVLGLGVRLHFWLNTQDSERLKAASTEAAAEAADVHATATLPLVLSFSQKATRSEVRYLGKPVWTFEHPRLQEKGSLQIPFPKEGVELSVIVEFEGDAQAAMRLQLTGPDGTEYDRSLWGAHTVEAVIPFP
ncbi:MAG: hypothetical protein WCL08_12520 [Verrucomicrobiota bacterium]